MGQKITDPKIAHELLVESAQDACPGPNDPGEPYFAVVGVTDDGKSNGALLCMRGQGLVLFLHRADGNFMIPKLPDPGQEILGKPARVHWEVRGLSRKMLDRLRADDLVQKHGAVVCEEIAPGDGRMTMVPLPKTEEEQKRYDAEKVAAMLLQGIKKFLPEKDAPGEPYFAIFVIGDDDLPTGDLWTADGQGTTALFAKREHGEEAVRCLAPPARDMISARQKPKSPTWQVRGLSKEHLAVLRTERDFKVHVGIVSGGRIAAVPIDVFETDEEIRSQLTK